METTLDGITLLRYAHIYRGRTSGGAEQYLKQLNEGLLAKYQMTILQMHLVPADSNVSALQIDVERIGRGQIIWIPVCVQPARRSLRSLPSRLRFITASKVYANSKEKQTVFSSMKMAFANSCGHLRYSEMVLSEGLGELLGTYDVKLIVFHWLSYDAGTLIAHAARRQIPYAIIHHFDNARLGLARTRRWVEGAAAIGGVSRRNVPSELKNRYINLSDAVDQNLFAPERAVPIPRPTGFVILLPGRIVQGKGHADLLLAVQLIARKGVKISVVCAGAVESASLKAELEKKASLGDMSQHVTFLGELTTESLRDWYAQCDVVALPSSSEGLPRVLLEAQAMGKPVIAYETGGTADALIANKTGFLIKTGDFVGLGELLKYLIDNPEQRSTMGVAGRNFISERFSVPALIERHERFCTKALSA